MPLRKREEGRLTIEQTRDLDRVRTLAAAAGLNTDGIEWPGGCYLIAYFGNKPVGAAGIESKVDVALIRSLIVSEPMRHRGIGSALLAAARKAAHTRGARRLFAFSTGAGGFFKRAGFNEISAHEAADTLAGTPQADYYRARPDELAREIAWTLDISNDGVIAR